MDCCVSDEPASEYLERRWFATLDAVAAQEAECETLLEVLKVSESAWRVACERLDGLLDLRNALEEQIDVLHGFKKPQTLQQGTAVGGLGSQSLHQDVPQEFWGGYKGTSPQPLRLPRKSV